MSRYPGHKGYRPYNGWWPKIRELSTPIIAAAYADGRLQRTNKCSVCERTFDDPVGEHLEDYSKPLAIYPICRKCHMLLHLRFWQRDVWLSHISLLRSSGWFQQLRCDPETLSRPFEESYPSGLPDPFT